MRSQREFKWADYLLQAVGSTRWQNRIEVEDRFWAFAPPEAFHRIVNFMDTENSMRSWLFTTNTRRTVRRGLIQLTKPKSIAGKNIGAYQMRLTRKGMKWLQGRHYYQCEQCLRVTLKKDSSPNPCIKCGSRHFRLVLQQKQQTKKG
jgi:hypothetical protein